MESCEMQERLEAKVQRYVGQQFADWTVVELAQEKPIRWKARCVCGTEVGMSTGQLNSGKLRACRRCRGRRWILDRVGQRVGSLTVTGYAGRFAGSRGGKPVHHATCRCDCGQETVLRQDRLSGEHPNKTCGCGRAGSNNYGWKGCGQLTGEKWGQILKGAKSRAQGREIPVEITIEEAWALFEAQDGKCALTGWPLVIYARSRSASADTTASLDRIDSSKGYVSGNVQWVHKHVNMAKHVMPQEDFIAMCEAVARYR